MAEDWTGFRYFSQQRYERDEFFYNLMPWFHVGHGNMSLVARDFQNSIYAFYTNRKLRSPHLVCTHTCGTVLCVRDTYVYRYAPADIYTQHSLTIFSPDPSLLPVGPRTPEQNIYVRVNWTLGIDVMQRKIKIGKTGVRTSDTLHGRSVTGGKTGTVIAGGGEGYTNAFP